MIRSTCVRRPATVPRRRRPARVSSEAPPALEQFTAGLGGIIARPRMVDVKSLPPPPLYSGERAGVRAEISHFKSQMQEPLTLTLSPGYRGEGIIIRGGLARKGAGQARV